MNPAEPMAPGFYQAVSPAFAEALVNVQGGLEGAKKDSQNPHLKNKYADLASCWDACFDALQKNRIAVVQGPFHVTTDGSLLPPGIVGIRTELFYGPTGEKLSYSGLVPVKDPTNPQALGSAITYGRRYYLSSVLGICPADDDGEAAANVKPKAQQSGPELNPLDVRAQFENLNTLEDRKSLYIKTKTANIPEPSKTALLKVMADKIKAEKETK